MSLRPPTQGTPSTATFESRIASVESAIALFTGPTTTIAVVPTADVVGWKFAPKSGGTADSIQFANDAGTVKAGFKSDGTFYSKTGSQFGNAAGLASTQYPGTGTSGPGGTPSSDIPWTLFHYFGQTATVPGTTQAGSVIAKYFNRTLDDSAEAFSAGVAFPDTGTPFTQTLPAIGLEGDFIIQGANISTNKGIGVGGGVFVQNTATVTSVMNFYAALKNVAVGATVTNAYGFYDEGMNGTATNVWSFYGPNTIQTAGRFVAGQSAVSSLAARAFIVGSSADTVGTLVAQAGSGQTAASVLVRDSGGTQRGQWFGQTGNVLIGNGATGGSGSAIISMTTVTVPSGTPPTAGAYLYVDPADSKLKAKTSGGTVTVLTPTI